MTDSNTSGDTSAVSREPPTDEELAEYRRRTGNPVQSRFEPRVARAQVAGEVAGPPHRRLCVTDDGSKRYLINEVQRLCDRVHWCQASRNGGDLDADLDALEEQRCVVERILAAEPKQGETTAELDTVEFLRDEVARLRGELASIDETARIEEYAKELSVRLAAHVTTFTDRTIRRTSDIQRLLETARVKNPVVRRDLLAAAIREIADAEYEFFGDCDQIDAFAKKLGLPREEEV